MQSSTSLSALTDLDTLTESWHLHLRAANLTPKTIKNYMEAARQLSEFSRERGMPTAQVVPPGCTATGR
jgi:DICT domain-containing protein